MYPARVAQSGYSERIGFAASCGDGNISGEMCIRDSILLNKLRIPHIIGMILAGLVIGEHGKLALRMILLSQQILLSYLSVIDRLKPVSYTHLDVYKRQASYFPMRKSPHFLTCAVI